MTDIRQAIINKNYEVITLARSLFPKFADAPMPSIGFFTNGKNAGTAQNMPFRVEYNLTVFGSDLERFLNDTVPHEIAHLVCFYMGLDKGHGKNWKRVCAMLGGNSKRCYQAVEGSIQFQGSRKVTEYFYIAPCGTSVWVSTQRHNAMTRGKQYRIVTSRQPLNSSHFMNQSRTR